MLLNKGSSEQVSDADLNALLGGRKFGTKQQPEQFEMNPAIPQYDENDMYELQEFCMKHGIIGVNFGKDNPKVVLHKLKARMGIVEQTYKRGILNG